MNKSHKKFVSICILTGLMVSALTGCTTSKENTTDQNASKTTESANQSESKPSKPVTISIEIFDRSNAPEGGGTVTENYVTKYVADTFSKESNVNIKWIPIPRSQEVDKLQVLMAGGTAPDLCFTYDKSLMFNFAKNGGLTEITPEMLSTNAPNLQEFLGDEVLNNGRYEGKMFAISGKRTVTGMHSSWIRKDLLDKVGLPIPTTRDELYTALKLIQEKDPGNVGKDKIVPFGMHGATTGTARMNYIQFLLSFASADATDEDYQVLPDFMYSGAKEGLAFLNKMYNDGVISKDFALDDTSKKFNEDVAMGRTVFFIEDVVVPAKNTSDGLINNLKTNVPGAELIPIDTLKDANGKYTKEVYSPTSLLYMIPKTAKNPEAALKFLDWTSQNQLPIIFGEEGVHYKVIDGLPTITDAERAKKDLWTCRDVCMISAVDLKSTEKNIKLQAQNSAPNQDIAEQALIIASRDGICKTSFDVPIQSEMKNGSSLKKIEQELIVKTIAAKNGEFEKTYTELVEKWLASGGQQVIEEKRAAYQNMNK